MRNCSFPKYGLSLFTKPEFALTDGFVATIRRKPERAFEAVGGEITGEIKSRPESLEMRVLSHLATAPLSKAALSAVLGHKEISGQLNKVIRVLLGDQTIEYTIPEKPNSRMQKYRLTEKGKAHLKGTSAKGEKG